MKLNEACLNIIIVRIYHINFLINLFLNYTGGLLSKKWKDYKFILYDSSLLTWYADVKHKKPDGMVLLKVILLI